MNRKNPLKIIFGTSSSKTDEIIYVREEDFEIPHGDCLLYTSDAADE